MSKKERTRKKRMKRQIAYIEREINAQWSRYKVTKDFLSHHYFGEGHSWADIYFVGRFRGEPVLWNCTIVTVYDEFSSVVDHQAYEEVNHKYPCRFLNDERGMPIFESAGDGKARLFRMVENPEWTDEVSAKYGAEMEAVKTRVSSDGMDVRAGYAVLEEYEFGVGLDIVVTDPWLTLDVVENAVREFNKIDVAGFGLLIEPSSVVRLTDKDLLSTYRDEQVRLVI